MPKQNIYNKLLSAIGNPYGVCGLMGNLQAESNFNSKNMQNSYEAKLGMNDETYTVSVDNGTYGNFCTDRVGYGLAQWTSEGRKTGLYKYAKSMGVSIGDEDMQIDYIMMELTTAYKAVLTMLQSAKSVKEASDCVVTKYERPADQSETALARRATYGEELYKELVEGGSNVSKTIVIDAGHGMNTAGKRCLKNIDPKETHEWYLNDRIADKLQGLLSAYDCRVIRADDTTGATDVSLSTRVSIANNANADVYLSIHHNAGINGGSGGGAVVFYYSSDAERQRQAQRLYNAIIARTNLIGNRAEKIVKKGFTVIANTKMPAFLIENGFMDSKHDTPIILTDDYAEKSAQGMLDWLVSEFGLVKTGNTAKVERPIEEDIKKDTTNGKMLYRVQIGAFGVKSNADVQLEKAKKAGFADAFITSSYVE